MFKIKLWYLVCLFFVLITMFIVPEIGHLTWYNSLIAVLLSAMGICSFVHSRKTLKSYSLLYLLPIIAALLISLAVPLAKTSFPLVQIIATGHKNIESKSSEAYVNIVSTGASKINSSGAGWEKKNGVYASYQNQPSILSLKGSWENGSYLNFSKHSYSGIVKLIINGHEQIIDLYSPVGSALKVALPDGRVSWISWLQRIAVFIVLGIVFTSLINIIGVSNTSLQKVSALCLLVASLAVLYVKDLSYTGDLEIIPLSGEGVPSKIVLDAGNGFSDNLSFTFESGSIHTETYLDKITSTLKIEVDNGMANRYFISGENNGTDECSILSEGMGCLYQITGVAPKVYVLNGNKKYFLKRFDSSKNKKYVYIFNKEGRVNVSTINTTIFLSAWSQFSQWVNIIAVTDDKGKHFSHLARISALKPFEFIPLQSNTMANASLLSKFKYEDSGAFYGMKIAFILICCSFVVLPYLVWVVSGSLLSSARSGYRKNITISVVAILFWLVVALLIGWPAIIGWDGYSPYIQAQTGQITLWYGIGYPLIVGGFLLSNYPQIITLWSFIVTSVCLIGAVALFFRSCSGKLTWLAVIWFCLYIPLSVIMLGMLTQLRDTFNGLLLSSFVIGAFSLAFLWQKLDRYSRIFSMLTLLLIANSLALLRVDNIPTLLIISIGVTFIVYRFNLRSVLFSFFLLINLVVVNNAVQQYVYPDKIRAEQEKRLYASTAVINPLSGILVYGKERIDPQFYNELFTKLDHVIDVDFAIKNWSPYNVVYWHQTAANRPLPTKKDISDLNKLYVKAFMQTPLLFIQLRLSTFSAILGKDISNLKPTPSPSFSILPGYSDHLLDIHRPWSVTNELMGFRASPHFHYKSTEFLMKWSDLVNLAYCQVVLCLLALLLCVRCPISAIISLGLLARCAIFFLFAPASVTFYLYELQIIGFALPILMYCEFTRKREVLL